MLHKRKVKSIHVIGRIVYFQIDEPINCVHTFKNTLVDLHVGDEIYVYDSGKDFTHLSCLSCYEVVSGRVCSVSLIKGDVRLNINGKFFSPVKCKDVNVNDHVALMFDPAVGTGRDQWVLINEPDFKPYEIPF